MNKLINQIFSELIMWWGRLRGRKLGISFASPNYIYKDVFDKDSMVIDVGCGFDADFSVYMIGRYGLKAVGVDPTKRHAKSLATVAKKYLGRFKHLAVAVSAEDGFLEFNESEDNVSGSLLSNHTNIKNDRIKKYKVESMSLKSLPARLGLNKVEFIKLDLEGAEYGLIDKLKSEDVTAYQQIFVEFHDHCVPSYTALDTRTAVNKMESLGFGSFTLDNHNYLFYSLGKKKVQKIKVVFEQQVIPHYRVPFFRELAKVVDLIVVASESKKIDGLNDVVDGLPFRSIRLVEDKKAKVFHRGMLELLEKERPDFYLSSGFALEQAILDRETFQKLKKWQIRIVWMGCDGYLVRNFIWGLLTDLFDPRRTRQTFKQIWVMSQIDFFVTYSSFSKEYLHWVRLVPYEKIVVGQNSIDTKPLEELREKWSRSNQKKITQRLVFTGRLIEGKQVETLFRAVAKLVGKYPNISLEIIGEGSKEAEYRQLVKELYMQNNIFFTGPVYDDKELAKKMLKAELYIIPGLGGLGINTAMALGLPIIHSYADGTEVDLVRDNYNGWFFNGTVDDLVAKIDLALVNPKKLALMGERSARLVEKKFNLTNMVKAYQHCFEKIVYEN